MRSNLCVFLFLCSFILLVYHLEARLLKRPAASPQHGVVRPVVLHGRTRRELSTTRHEGNTHHPAVVVEIDVEGEKYILELELNHGLLSEGHTISYQEGSETVLHKPQKEEIELCQYTGHVRGKPSSMVALSTCHGLRGVIHDGAKIRYIDPAEGSNLQSLHYVYEHTATESGHKCGTEGQGVEEDDTQLVARGGNGTRRNRHKRDITFPVPRGLQMANDNYLYVELVLVADHAQYLGANKNLTVLHHQLQETTNILNALYAPLGILIALTGVEVWTEKDKITLNLNSGDTLVNFREYRYKNLFETIGPHDHAQLITDTPFDEGVGGIAYTRTICSNYSSCGLISKNGHAVTAADLTMDAKVLAHEMGHSFGMPHDDDLPNCVCPANKICFQKNAGEATHWSDCNIEELQNRARRGQYECLRNKPERLFGAPSCGNGFVEPGEDCDCGVRVEGVPTTTCHICCDLKTCKMQSTLCKYLYYSYA